MAYLLALVFDDPYKADEARAALLRLEGEGQLVLQETAVISQRADGRTRMSQDTDVVGRDQHFGHLAGLLAAAVTGTLPFILGGTLAGRLLGRLTDHGVTNAFIKDVKGHLQPGTSCLMVSGTFEPSHRTAIIDRMRPFAPRIIESDLPAELEADVKREMAADSPPSSRGASTGGTSR